MLRIHYPKTTAFFIIVFAIYWSFSSLMPSENYFKPETTQDYSLEKALVHLKKMTKAPHFVGSDNHKVVRDYIVEQLQALGLQVQLQDTLGINEKWRSATKTQNILARIKGTNSGGKALLLLSHYDSSPHSSKGASDDGVGVATILEGLRSYLAKGKQPKNDIIILIDDAEETGLNGADAFVRFHPWAKEVGLVINFEARGSGGASYLLMETNGGNASLLKAYNKAKVRYTVGNSLMYSIYKMLPNDTDLTVFREQADIEGLNFAFIGDHYDYHTAEDSYENVDLNTMVHQATYLLPLLDYFSQADLANLKSAKDYVFINLPFIGLLQYPFSWVIPMWVLAALLFLYLSVVAFRKNVVSHNEAMQSFKAFFTSLLLNGILTFLGWKILLIIYPNYNLISHGYTYNGHLYQLFFVLISIAATLKVYEKFTLKISKASLLVAPLFFWLLVNAFLALKLQGAGFFIIPVFLGLAIFAILIFSRQSIENSLAWIALLMLPVILMFAPLIEMLPVGLGLKMLFVSSMLVVMVFTMISPIFMTFKRKKPLKTIMLLLAVVVFFKAHFQAPFNENRKRPNSINFMYDKDLDKSFWFTYDKTLDAYTKQVFTNDSPIGDLGIVLGNKHGDKVQRYQPTINKKLQAATVLKVHDTIVGDSRKVTFHIVQQRKLNQLIVVSKNDLKLKTMQVQGVDFDKKKSGYVMETNEYSQSIMNYYFTAEDEILDISFSFAKNEKPILYLYEITNDLLEDRQFKLRERTVSMLPKPFIVNDAVIVRRKLNL